MEIHDNFSNDIVVITILGNIDALTAPQITEHIRGHISNGKTKLISDLKEVPYTSSAGLRMLLTAVKETRSKNGDMRLANIQPDVYKVLTLTGFNNIIKIFPDIDAAVKSYA